MTSEYVMIRLKQGDPTFNFTGFGKPAAPVEIQGPPEKGKELSGTWENIELNVNKKIDGKNRFELIKDYKPIDGKLIINFNQQPTAIALRLKAEGQSQPLRLNVYFKSLGQALKQDSKVYDNNGKELGLCSAFSPPCIVQKNVETNLLSIDLPANIDTGQGYVWIGATSPSLPAAPQGTSDNKPGQDMYGQPCDNGAGMCLTSSYCKEGQGQTSSQCGASLVCCKDQRPQDTGTQCGPKFDFGFQDPDFIGTPKCEKACPQGTKFFPKGAKCVDQCCITEIKCSTQPDEQLKGLTEKKQSAGIDKMTSLIARQTDNSITPCPGSGTGLAKEICLPGVTDDTSSVDYGKCIALNDERVLNKYCRWMTGNTCRATEGLAKDFYDACAAKGLVTWLCRCLRENKDNPNADCTAKSSNKNPPSQGWIWANYCRTPGNECYVTEI